MERLVSHFLTNVMSYMTYQDEGSVLKQWGCKQPSNELCGLVREYQNTVSQDPTLSDFIRHFYKPCEISCPFYVPMDLAYPVVVYSIRELGYISMCEKVFTMYRFHMTHGRYPSEMELTLEHVNRQFQQSMEQLQHVNNRIRDMVPKQPTPISYADKYPPYLLKKDIEADCCMCQERLLANQRIMTLPCFHSFHCPNIPSDCGGIEKWLEKQPLCPLCKHEV